MGPTVTRPVQDPLAVALLDNQLYILLQAIACQLKRVCFSDFYCVFTTEAKLSSQVGPIKHNFLLFVDLKMNAALFDLQPHPNLVNLLSLY